MDFLLCFVELVLLVRFGTVWAIQSRVASPNQFPWHVSVVKMQEDVFFCGGTIISEEWVLTAALCIYDADGLLVSYGNTDTEGPDVGVSLAEQYFVHDDFDVKTLTHNVGLIRLDEALVFDQYVQAVKLFDGDVLPQQKIVVSTWGLNEPERHNILYYFTLTTLDEKECIGGINPEMICATSDVPIPSDELCRSENGSPAVFNQTNVLVAIFNNDLLCNGTSYTRIGFNRNWIRSISGI